MAPSEDSDITDKLVPVDLHNNPISDDGQAAYLAGALHEASLFYERTGHFENLIKYGAFVSHTGTTVVESANTTFILDGAAPDVEEYTFMKPCPTTDKRMEAFDAAAAIAGTPTFLATIKGAPRNTDDYKVSELKIKAEDRSFANSAGARRGVTSQSSGLKRHSLAVPSHTQTYP